MTVYFSDLDNYGREIDNEMILNKYRIYFEKSFSTDQVIHAIHTHCETKTIVPKVSDLMEVLNPKPMEITQTEYFHAKKQWELSDYNQFSRHLDVIKAYEKQSQIKASSHIPMDNPDVLKLVNNTIKRIG